jgi:predicted flap endonuclease-1-like 5' DNA nuclease
MKDEYTWAITATLSLPFAWVVAYLFYLRPIILSNLSFILAGSVGLIFGLLVSGIFADRFKWSTHFLVITEILLLLIGIFQFTFSPGFWYSPAGIGTLTLLSFLLGVGLILLTIFLNKLVSSLRRGRVVGIVTAVILVVGGILSFVWRVFPTTFAPSITAALIFFGMIIGFIVLPRKIDLQTYMVPGSILPYAIWWIIYLAAYGLFVWATPFNLRFLFFSIFISVPFIYTGELVLLGIGGAIFVFTFLPDKLGRKRVFSIATVLLGVVCVFGGAQLEAGIGQIVSVVLSVLQGFVIGFIIGVGAWLVWAEIGAVRFKGQRVAFGWALVALLVIVIIVITMSLQSPVSEIAALLFPLSALLVLVGVFPLTNAVESLDNERIVEEIDVRVDSRQVSRAIRDLEVDTSLKSIEAQIESEISQLTQIRGLTRNQAKELRDAGYETPALVARARVDDIAQILSISPEKAANIITNARKVSEKKSKSRIRVRPRRNNRRESSKK